MLYFSVCYLFFWAAVSALWAFLSSRLRSFYCILLFYMLLILSVSTNKIYIAIMSVCLFVCLTVRSHIPRNDMSKFHEICIHVRPTCGLHSIFLWRQRGAFPVLWMKSCFDIIERIGENQRWCVCIVEFARMAVPGRCLPPPTTACFNAVGHACVLCIVRLQSL